MTIIQNMKKIILKMANIKIIIIMKIDIKLNPNMKKEIKKITIMKIIIIQIKQSRLHKKNFLKKS